jgi:glycogen debranching enzyme
MFEHDINLKGNEIFLIGQSQRATGMAEAGLYLRDTRFLSGFNLRVNDSELITLDVRARQGRRAVINLTNPITDAFTQPAHTVGIEQTIELNHWVRCSITVQNFRQEPDSLKLTIDVCADFLDMFEVRGLKSDRRGTVRKTSVRDGGLVLQYDSLGGNVLSTTLAFTPAPDAIEPGAPGSGSVQYDLDLDPGELRRIDVEIRPDPANGLPVAAFVEPPEHSSFWCNDIDLQALVDQSTIDLDLLQTQFPDGSIPAAGTPWYIAPFGRDSLIVSLQTMHAYPERIASTLRLLAANQGKKIDAFREEQPGKILHEIRYGEMALSGQVPHTPYYGSIDATPLFVLTFAQYSLWHRDKELWRELVESVKLAIEWIEAYGDLDGDGLIEFMGLQSDPAHIAQQGWKDSFDSLHHPDGTPVGGPIALVEVQGYVFAAYNQLAEAARVHGDTAWSTELRRKADALRGLVEDTFWMEDEGFYAQALDGNKRRVEAISSNPGHLLFCGLPSPERAARVGKRLMQDDLYAGWGIRTLSSTMPTYNPMSYHNGSIWPHDTSLAMWGLREYGLDTEAVQIALGLIGLAYYSPRSRLAELYCGYSSEGHEDGPVDYPVSCSPQAWAAASAHLLVRTLLGIRPDFHAKTIHVDPFFPEQVEAISLIDLPAFGETYDLSVQVLDDHYHVAQEGNVKVTVAGSS